MGCSTAHPPPSVSGGGLLVWRSHGECHATAVLHCRGFVCSLVASSKFGLQADKTFSAKANALMSTFYFGLPLPGYTVITGDQYDEQVSKVRGRQ